MSGSSGIGRSAATAPVTRSVRQYEGIGRLVLFLVKIIEEDRRREINVAVFLVLEELWSVRIIDVRHVRNLDIRSDAATGTASEQCVKKSRITEALQCIGKWR